MQTTGPQYRMSPGKGAALSFLALFMPPLTVVSVEGCNSALTLNLLLTVLGWIPGMIHAYYIVCKHTSLAVGPCCACAKTHHCQGHGHGQLSHVERGEGVTTHHYHTAEGEVQVQTQTTVRLPGGPNALVAQPQPQPQPQSPMYTARTSPSSAVPSLQSSSAPSALRAYEAQAPAYQQKEYDVDAKAFAVRH